VQEAGPERLTGVYGYYGTSAIFVTKKVMAPSDANDLEAGFRQASDQFSAGDFWAPAHAAMVIR
jgi:hypothetical protein